MSLQPARDSRGHWRRGVSGNPGGRPSGPLVRHVRQLARSYGEEMIAALRGIALDEDANANARVAAAKEILSRGYGTPNDEVTLQTLDRGQEEADVIRFVWPMTIDGVEIEDAELVDAEPPALPPAAG